MTVEVQNLQSGEIIEVGPEGTMFGREGGPANVRLPDASVSKRHARIFADAAGWFIEDMGSVNGTVVDGSKIGGPVALRPGLIFQMSKQRFEVVAVDGRGVGRSPAGAPEQETRTAMRQGGGSPLPPEQRREPPPKKKAPSPRVDDALPPLEAAASPGFPQPGPPPGRAPWQGTSDADLLAASGGAGAGEGSPGSAADDVWDEIGFGGACFEGLAYLVKTAPMLVVNPLGTTRQHIETVPLPALQKGSLVALLAPTTLTAALLPAIAGALGAVVGGSASVGAVVLGLVVAVVVGVVGAVVGGFAGHPVLGFLLRSLGGSADARSRTTHLAQGAVAALLVSLVAALTAVLAALTARLAGLSPTFHLIVVVPALLGLVAYPVPMVVQWLWFKAHGVAQWFQSLWGVASLLALVAGIALAGTTVWGGVQAMRATVTASTPVAAPVAGPADAGPGDEVVVDAGPPDPDSVGGDAAPASTTTSPGSPGAASNPPPASSASPSQKPGASSRGAAAYADYARKRARIEAVLDADPTLLNDVAIATRYKALSSATYKAEQEAEEAATVGDSRRRQRDPALGAYVEKLKRARVYEATGRIVDGLYAALGEP